MLSLNDLVHEIAVVREVLDNLEVKGRKNTELVTLGYDKCEGLIKEITSAIEEITKSEAPEPEEIKLEFESSEPKAEEEIKPEEVGE